MPRILASFTGSKNLSDTETGIKIEFLVEGEYPGDGLAKPVAFPAPASVSMECDGIKYVNLPALVEMKIASGMTKPERMKDLSDVQELINKLNLSEDFASQLNPYVREKYIELWKTIKMARKRYMQIWRNKFLTLDAQSLDDMIEKLQEAVNTLKAMRADGVVLDPQGGTGDDYARLATSDPDVARKYDLHDEAEFWNEGLDEDESKENS